MTFKEWIKYLFYTTFYKKPLLKRRLCKTCMHHNGWKCETPCDECNELHDKYRRDWQKWGKYNNLFKITFEYLWITACVIFIIAIMVDCYKLCTM